MNAHIERMAREAGLFVTKLEYKRLAVHGLAEQFEAFARLIAEDCAEVAEAAQTKEQFVANAIRERYK